MKTAIVVVALGLLAGGGLWLTRRGPAADGPPALPDTVEPITRAALEPALARVRAEPNSAEAWGECGKALRAYDLQPQANACFRRAMELDPSDGRWAYLLGLRLILDRPADAVPLLRLALERGLDSGAAASAVRLRLAELLLAQQETDEAEAMFRRVADADPQSDRARYGLALVALERGQWDAAEDLLRPLANSPRARKRAAGHRAFLAQRRSGAAAAAALRAEADALPDDQLWYDPLVAGYKALERGGRATFIEAENRKRAGDFEGSVRLFRELVASERSAQSLAALGGALLAAGRHDEAEAVLTEAHGLDPTASQTLVYRCRARLAANRWADAEADARAVARLKPVSAAGHHYLGLALLGQNRPADAAAALQSATRCRPESADLHAELARARHRAGDRAGARAALALAESLEPNNPLVAEARAELGR